jgi:transcription-repair coupling factor (superfamily II helicase)
MSITLPTLTIVDQVVAALQRAPRVADVAGPWGSAKTLLAVQAAAKKERPLLMVTSGRLETEAVYDDLCTFAGEDKTVLFPAWEVLPSDTMNPADDIVAERMNALKRLARAQADKEVVHAVMPIRSLLQYVVDRKRLVKDTLTLRVGEEVDLDDLLEGLIKLGYGREVMVEARGEVSVRGGLVDVFPISSELPCRIEFFGDEIESIRYFEPETQRSVESAEDVQILPRSEKGLLGQMARAQETLSAITTYFPKNALVVLDEPLRVTEEAEKLTELFGDSPYYLPWEKAKEAIGKFAQLWLSQVGMARTPDVPRITVSTRSINSFGGRSDDFWKQLEEWELEGYTVRLLSVNTGEQRRMLELLEEHGHRLEIDAFDLRVELGRLQAGFAVPKDKLAVLSEREIFGRHYIRRKRRRFEAGAAITQFSDLKAGEYVVHQVHGVARYLGLKRFEGKAGDFMCLQYAKGDLIYVPVTHIDYVQKFSAGEGAVPRIDKVGGKSWARTKARVKKAVRDMTEDLVQLYSRREHSRGNAFSPDTPWQQEFEDAFEYDETPDQARAILEVKADMEKSRPMDRLLCGDVGYGKTEVALRAAFKAVGDGKQVALLAPTTVLTQQHFSTFSERMADFPVRIEVLNRFRTAKQQRETIERLKSGEVDIVIGTHRLTSKDVAFKDLGLLIIDEEQRFGVAQKERLKQLRTHVDVLTMSATPIPRTLHFSLLGVRDMSSISTAPNDRLPIHTCIDAWDKNLIKEALERELGREGQVFFLHNRVQTIAKVASYLREIVPAARIAIGHGQMHKHELEDVMTDFINKKVDVLVCTTIIGSGIDIPNANTILVDRADNFGLSELYQIRGRVGRYKNRAFAYLLIPGDRALTEEAQQRLTALQDFSALGSGFRIAMRDLEIRGTGDLLGADQSGHIATVGYETYRELIEEAVAEIKGEPIRRRTLPSFDASSDAHIPESYIAIGQQRMTLYRRIANIHTVDEVDEITEELKDRFGAPPAPVRRLLNVMRVRAAAVDFGIHRMSGSQGRLRMEFDHPRRLNHAVQQRLRHALGESLTIDLTGPAPTLTCAAENQGYVQEAHNVFQALEDVG